MNSPTDRDFARTLKCAEFYRGLGWQPLPSKMNVKGPMLHTFAEYWDKPIPDSVYSADEWKTTNIQLMTGVHWKLCVVDCDGDEAKDVWARMCEHHGGCPETWTVATGGGGTHFYFRTPEWIDECPSRRLWGVWDTFAGTRIDKPGSTPKGDWQKHKEIRLLGDRALAIAPPSIHVTTGKPYTWINRDRMVSPIATAPAWLMKMPEIISPITSERVAPISMPQKAPACPAGASYRREEVLSAIPSKIDVARRWGLRPASHGPNPKGWWTVHAIDRDDNTPSASFHDGDGVYWENREDVSMSLFDLAVALNAYPSWQECRDALGDEFIAKRQPVLTSKPRPARIFPPSHAR